MLQRFFADQCPQQAAAIAHRVLFPTAPLAIILVSIFGLLLQDDSLREDVVDAIVDALPVTVAGRQDVEDAITAIATRERRRPRQPDRVRVGGHLSRVPAT